MEMGFRHALSVPACKGHGRNPAISCGDLFPPFSSPAAQTHIHAIAHFLLYMLLHRWKTVTMRRTGSVEAVRRHAGECARVKLAILASSFCTENEHSRRGEAAMGTQIPSWRRPVTVRADPSLHEPPLHSPGAGDYAPVPPLASPDWGSHPAASASPFSSSKTGTASGKSRTMSLRFSSTRENPAFSCVCIVL